MAIQQEGAVFKKTEEKSVDTIKAKVTPIPGRHKVYKVALYLGRVNGKVKTITKTIEGLKAANEKARWLEAHRSELLQEAETNEADSKLPKLEAAINQYITAGLKSWSPKTTATKEHRLKHYLLEGLGNIPLNQITPIILQTLQDKLQNELSENTVAAIMRTAAAMFEQLVKWQYLEKSPCAGLTKLKAKPAPRKFWNAAEFEQALKCAPLWLRLLLATGIRPEELQGLRWEAIDWQTNSLLIKAVAYYQNGCWQLRAGAKTATSERRIPLDEITMQALRDRSAAVDAASAEFVITAPRGGIVPLNTLRVWFKAFCDVNGLPLIPLYSIRHSSLTYLLEHGVMIKTVAARAGHASVNTTLTRYAQVSDASAIQAAQIFAI